MKYPDIDIDTQTTFSPDSVFKNITRASRVHNGELLKHPCGYYFQNIPVDKITGLAAIPYKEADDMQYFKVDFLHLEVYDIFDNREQMEVLLKEEPNWSLLEKRDNVEKLFQLKNHADVVIRIKPKSIKQIADVLALIRPGKWKLIDQYINGTITDDEIYGKTVEGYTFKKSHAIAYAHVVVLQMHMIEFGII